MSLRTLRSLALYVAVAAVVATAAGVAGFAYAHEPEREALVVTFERATPAPAAAGILRGGTIATVEPGRLRIDAPEGPFEVALSAGMTIEELVRVSGDQLRPGNRINVGVQRTDTGLVLTGIVALEGAP